LEKFEEFEKQYANIRLVKVQNNEAFGVIKTCVNPGKAAKKKSTHLPMLIVTQHQKIDHGDESHSLMQKNNCFGIWRILNNSFLNVLIRFETVLTAMQYFHGLK
jgi:hypothetical protein